MSDTELIYDILKELKDDVRDGFKENKDQHCEINDRLTKLEVRHIERRAKEKLISRLITAVVGIASAILGLKLGGK